MEQHSLLRFLPDKEKYYVKKSNPDKNERVQGFEIKRAIVFENDQGFALWRKPERRNRKQEALL